jgi:hypothetical protein
MCKLLSLCECASGILEHFIVGPCAYQDGPCRSLDHASNIRPYDNEGADAIDRLVQGEARVDVIQLAEGAYGSLWGGFYEVINIDCLSALGLASKRGAWTRSCEGKGVRPILCTYGVTEYDAGNEFQLPVGTSDSRDVFVTVPKKMTWLQITIVSRLVSMDTFCEVYDLGSGILGYAPNRHMAYVFGGSTSDEDDEIRPDLSPGWTTLLGMACTIGLGAGVGEADLARVTSADVCDAGRDLRKVISDGIVAQRLASVCVISRGIVLESDYGTALVKIVSNGVCLLDFVTLRELQGGRLWSLGENLKAYEGLDSSRVDDLGKIAYYHLRLPAGRTRHGQFGCGDEYVCQMPENSELIREMVRLGRRDSLGFTLPAKNCCYVTLITGSEDLASMAGPKAFRHSTPISLGGEQSCKTSTSTLYATRSGEVRVRSSDGGLTTVEPESAKELMKWAAAGAEDGGDIQGIVEVLQYSCKCGETVRTAVINRAEPDGLVWCVSDIVVCTAMLCDVAGPGRHIQVGAFTLGLRATARSASASIRRERKV